MTRTDRNRLLKLCMLAAPLLFVTACAEREPAPAEAAAAEAAPINAPELPEVVVSAPRLDPEERTTEDDRNVVARTDR